MSDSDSSHSSISSGKGVELQKEETKVEAPQQVKKMPTWFMSEYKFIPMPGAKGENVPFVQIKRRPTLMKNQILDVKEDEIDEMLLCVVCKNVLQEPRECTDCRVNFCRACVDERKKKGIDNCPGCNFMGFEMCKTHPYVVDQLKKLKVSCDNKAKGCMEKIAWKEINQHRFECLYQTLQCPNFGCSGEYLRKDYAEHEKICEFRDMMCEKCGFKIMKEQDGAKAVHNCAQSTQAKFKELEEKITTLKTKMKFHAAELGKNMHKDGKYVRYGFELPELAVMQFDPHKGWTQTIHAACDGMPTHDVRAVTIKFSVSDMNICRRYSRFDIKQLGATETSCNLMDYFSVGQQQLPVFGMATEVTMPWDSELENGIDATFTCQVDPMEGLNHNQASYASIQIVGFHLN